MLGELLSQALQLEELLDAYFDQDWEEAAESADRLHAWILRHGRGPDLSAPSKAQTVCYVLASVMLEYARSSLPHTTHEEEED